MELSRILISDIISELAINAKFAALSADVKLQVVRDVLQRVLSDYKRVGSSLLISTSVTIDGPPNISGVAIRVGTATVDMAGTVVTFSTAMPGTYNVTAWEAGGQPIITDTLTLPSFKAYSTQDGATIFYIAIQEV